jgi:small subunit ribosomal protein S13
MAEEKIKQAEEKVKPAEEKLKQIVRISNTDLNGNKAVLIGLTKIKGIGIIFSNAVCKVAKVPRAKKVGALETKEIEALNSVLADPAKHGVPSWMFNRKYDIETGETKHLIMGDLTFVNQQDVRRMQKIRSYKGVRHAAGLTVRGQRTKSNSRKNKGKAMGVKRSKAAGPTGKA